MAESTVTVAVTSISSNQDSLIVRGTLAVSVSPGTYPTGGYALSFASGDIPSAVAPRRVEVNSSRAAGSSAANLYVYQFLAGTTVANGKLQVFTGAAAQTALTELSAGNTPAGVSGDTIVFEAEFPKNL